MKFTLTYDGELPATGNSSRKPEKKWLIRCHVNPQLQDLWVTHPTLLEVRRNRYSTKKSYFWIESHHSTSEADRGKPNEPGPETIDLCEPVEVEGYKFVPLVRNHLALVCSLKILFMRKGPVGRVYNAGGDLDNRVKTLLDGLRVPHAGEVSASKPTEDSTKEIFCLLEDDALVTGLEVETRQLLNRPNASDCEVRLVIDVDVRVTHPRAYNNSFLGD